MTVADCEKRSGSRGRRCISGHSGKPHDARGVCSHPGVHILKRLHFKEQTSPFNCYNACNRGKGGANVYNFLSLQFLSAVFPSISSKDRLSVSRP